MKIINYLDIKPVQEFPGVVMREPISAGEAPRFYMRIYELEPGGETETHTHWWEHELFVLSGEGQMDTGKEKIPMAQNNVIYIAPGEPHGFINNGSELLRYILLNPKNR
ncbi:MAG: cupin domain-containing protein [Chloroflexi bacterium]|nr:cupin domain-containing protein [Chloroflexota bacterium]